MQLGHTTTLETTRRPGRRKARGQALVEFALIFPVFVLVLAGILDFGFMLYSRMTVINAAREGARTAVTATDRTTIPALVHGRVLAVSSTLVAASLTDAATCVAIITSPGPCTFSTATSAKAGDAISVTVTYQYKAFFPLLFGKTFTLSSTVQMVME